MSLLDQLVSYWKLDEASGNALDAHGSNDLTDNNTVGSTTGKIGSGRQFVKANNEYFEIASNADLQTGDIDFFLQVWVKLSSKGVESIILSKWGTAPSGGSEYIIYYDNAADRFTFVVSNPAQSVFTTAAANNLGSPSTGVWYCIHVWHDSVNNQIAIAVNNGTPNTTSHSDGVRSASQSFKLGRNTGFAPQDLNGVLDEVGLWKRIPTSDERTALYNSGNGLAYEDFGGGSTTYTGAAALSIAATTLTAAATHQTATWTATADLALGATVLAASVTHVTPTWSAAAALAVAATQLDAAALFAAEIHSASASLTTAAAELAAIATFDAPVFEATVELVAAPAELVAAATFDAPTYSSAASLTLAAPTLGAIATFEAAPGAFSVAWAAPTSFLLYQGGAHVVC